MATSARTIRVTIDPASAKAGAGVVKSELRGIAAEARTTARSQAELTRAANDNSRSMREQARSTGEASKAMLMLNTALKGFVGIAAARYLIGLADGFTRFTNSLRVANVEGDRQKLVIDKLYASAQKYGVQLEAMGALYGKASQAQKTLNASQGDLLKFTNGVAAALKVQGGTVESAAGALHQLGQAITGNKIQAEEYNSILDGAYPILQAVAAGSEKYRGSVAALTADVKKGNVTSKQFFEDFLKGSVTLEQRASKANFTVAQSWQVLTNAMQKYVGEADQANAVTSTIGAGLRGLGENLDTVVPLVGTLAVGLGVGFVTRAVAATEAVKAASGAMALMGATARGAGAALLGAFGGPIGMAITGVSLLLIGMFNNSRNMEAAFQSTAQAADQFGVKLTETAQAARLAAGETQGVGDGAAGAEPAIWSFKNASGSLTEQLWEQAKAARAARVELLQTKLAEQNKNVTAGQDATFEGARMNSRAAFHALGQGDVMGFFDYGGRSLMSDTRNLLSGGRTGRQGRDLATNAGRVGGQIQREIDQALNTPIGASDVPRGGGSTPATSGGNKKDDKKGASEAERKAKAQKEFWQGLEREVELSAMTTQQAEVRRKQVEIEELTGQKIADLDAARVAAGEKTVAQLIEQRNANAFITQQNETNRQAEMDYKAEAEIAQLKLKGMSEEQIAVERAAIEFKNQLQKDGIKLDEKTLATLEAQVRERAKENAELAKRNRLIADGEAAAAKYSASYEKSQQTKSFANESAALDALYDGGNNPNFSKSQYEEAKAGLTKAIEDAARAGSQTMQNHWGSAITDLGNQIGGEWGAAIGKLGAAIQNMVASAQGDFAKGGILGSIASLLGKKVGPGGKLINNAFGDAVQGGATNFNDRLFGNSERGIKSALSEPLQSISGSITDFKKAFDPKQGGSIAKGLGNALGGAMQGAQMGSQVAGFGKMLWGKFSSTGAQLGGALGSIAGPIGSLAGSIVGGIVGGLLKKSKWGTTSVRNGVISTKGNDKNSKSNSSAAGNSIVSGLDSIAEQLGASADGDYAVSIGQYKDKWRVSRTGRTGSLKGGGNRKDIKDFGKDGAEAALAYAIQDAIRDGAITGLRATTQAILNVKGDLEVQLTKALKFEGVFKELKQRTNPVTAAVEALNLEFKSLNKVFKDAGATAEEYAQFEQLKQMKLKEVLDSALSPYQDTLNVIRGEASGKSQLTLFNEDMAKVNAYRSTIAAGGTVDSEKFNDAVQSAVGRAGDIWGTQTSQYQNVLTDLGSLVEGAMSNTKSEWEKAANASMTTTTAVDDMKDQVTTRLDTTNGWLAVIAKAVTNGQAIGGFKSAENGKLLKAN